MSEPINTGGPAFPCPHPSAPEVGMSLRAYMATKAMAAIMSNPEHHALSLRTVINNATMFADALIEELNQ